MSDTIIKLIPEDYHFTTTQQNIYEATKILKNKIQAEAISSEENASPVFVDCGENLIEIRCPICGQFLDMDWWGDYMSKIYNLNGFEDLTILLPCCNNKSTLNDLSYNFPCGFSRLIFSIINPKNPVEYSSFKEIETLLSQHFKMISAYY